MIGFYQWQLSWTFCLEVRGWNLYLTDKRSVVCTWLYSSFFVFHARHTTGGTAASPVVEGWCCHHATTSIDIWYSERNSWLVNPPEVYSASLLSADEQIRWSLLYHCKRKSDKTGRYIKIRSLASGRFLLQPVWSYFFMLYTLYTWIYAFFNVWKQDLS